MSQLERVSAFLKTVCQTGLFAPQDAHATFKAPEALHGDLMSLLHDDYNYALARWFLSSLLPAESESCVYAELYGHIRGVLSARFPNEPLTILHESSSALSRIIIDGGIGRKKAVRGASAALDVRFQLLSRSDRRCSICGYRFSEQQSESFMSEKKAEPIFQFYDFLKPTRQSPMNSRIEIDHVYPVALGGHSEVDNLQLLCGFCNRAKRDRLTLFDGGLSPKLISHPRLGKFRITSDFLVVRAIVGARCFSCGKKSTQTELTIATLMDTLELNPTNIRVTCYSCDPMRDYRHLAVKGLVL